MRFIYEFIFEVQSFTILVYQSTANLFRKPRYFQDTFQQMEAVGVSSLTIIALTGFFTGGVLALQTSKSLQSFGAVNLTGQLVALSLIRELGPVLTALMVADLDRARTERPRTSFGRRLRYVITGTSRTTGRGELYVNDRQPIGIASWASEDSEAGVIPAETINEFLEAARQADYKGFGAVGFVASELLDPARRSYLRLPDSIKGGAVVTDVYTLGTGSDALKIDDVILGIDGQALDAFGRYTHPVYELLGFEHLICSKRAGQSVSFDLWRDGRRMALDVEVKNLAASEMLVPYQEFDRQPEYIVTAGFVLQKLTREYLREFGDDWAGEAPSHLYHYYRDLAFKPSEQRRDVVILSYVLPARINLGYIGVGQIVVKEFNGMPICSIGDILAAQKLNPDSAYDVITFEMDNPTVVIPRSQLAAADAMIRQNYAVTKPANVSP